MGESQLKATWRDLLPTYTGALFFAAALYTHITYDYLYLIVWISYVLIPLLDAVIPVDMTNIPAERSRVLEKDPRFLIPLYLMWVMDFGLYFSLLYQVGTGSIAQTLPSLIYYVFCSAHFGAIDAAIGHELAHRKSLVHKVLGNLVYSKMLYSHFYLQHVKSHHKKVATPEDSSTARFGESLFTFWARAVPAGLVETWELETKRLGPDNRPVQWWEHLLYNRLIQFNVGHITYLVALYALLGSRALAFQLMYAPLVALMYETINYVEHYGLMRKLQPGGIYESVKITHSWNAPQVVANNVLFKL